MVMNTRLVFARFLAILVLVIPGLMAMKGFLMMKDALFLYYAEHGNDQISPGFQWLSFGGGLLLFAAGMSFLGGWILFRDRKRNYVGPRFRSKNTTEQAETPGKLS
ncbi:MULTISPECIES: DUF2627 domain-containing protein [Paenibacillus]|jgi:hypothetical protein|uniref:DUF2627 domain-containing protein n=1 Tax=Paenibacillus illinoisensis TaxID=59845 RepID=A0A2W0CM39_9BACL|nr:MULTISPECIES: DUF2627 domain-containing protein [Paenibacillus]MBM6386604.1 DUF2627 domain-containing protein [Paenibacillus sp.]MBE7682567.1 DUF2627 family protein [Paenibacillus sp. P13VS]MBY0216755.1 DUF2627 domain-containing protein [Paenibacillus illinoisensis]MCG7383626.1 DUF2627 domain-containing protein [Paenibacillus sp. ACRRY]MCM3208165.1 DUF2627 domain-containing protein [Paenibacillus illinoisensis]